MHFNLRFLETKIPPPIVALLTAALMWYVSVSVATMPTGLHFRIVLTSILLCIGVGIELLSLYLFFSAKTTINPIRPSAQKLVQTSVYRLTRNPMYLGLLLNLLALAFFLDHLLAMLFIPIFVIYITNFQIIPEERILRQKFGDAYISYQSKTRRWM